MSANYSHYENYGNNASNYCDNHALHITCLTQCIAMKTMTAWYLSGYAT